MLFTRRRWWIAAFALAAITCATSCEAAGGDSDEDSDDPSVYLPIRIRQILDREVKPASVVYLNREGATLYPGQDESSRNRSSIVQHAGLDRFHVPAFRGSATRWNQLVSCVRGHFEAYGVTIVEQRPVRPGYVMAVIGGEPGPLRATHDHGNVTGLAPFNGQPVENAVVLIFSRALRENARRTCETAAMEIAHAYGLDHTRHCRDLMSYRRPCGARRFFDEEVPCGEDEDRTCGDGEPTQNTHLRLRSVLGPAEAEEPAP